MTLRGLLTIRWRRRAFRGELVSFRQAACCNAVAVLRCLALAGFAGRGGLAKQRFSAWRPPGGGARCVSLSGEGALCYFEKALAPSALSMFVCHVGGLLAWGFGSCFLQLLCAPSAPV